MISRLGGDTCTTLEFLNVANIHVMRESFACLMSAVHDSVDDSFLSQLNDSRWLHHVSTILKGWSRGFEGQTTRKRRVVC